VVGGGTIFVSIIKAQTFLVFSVGVCYCCCFGSCALILFTVIMAFVVQCSLSHVLFGSIHIDMIAHLLQWQTNSSTPFAFCFFLLHVAVPLIDPLLDNS
jgi:hypothetical protein